MIQTHFKRTIIWDFNGTLLNDMQICVDCMNILLENRGLARLDLARYRDIFTFPVRYYYQQLGFDFEAEPFEVPAHQFIELYRARLPSASLHPETTGLLEYFREKGFIQIILSAMEQQFLEETLISKGITDYFEVIAGIRDHLADGKLQMAGEILKRPVTGKESYTLIGDTIHDYDVAKELGISCILVANGHQSFDRLRNSDCKVLMGLENLKTEFR